MKTNLECVGLSKRFDGLLALSGVDLSFPLSGIIALIGPNGAGKTTFLNILTGMLRPDSGQVFFLGREITGLATYRLARLGIVRTFQNARLVRQSSVLENIMLAHPAQRGETVIGSLIGSLSEEAAIQESALELLEAVGLLGRTYANAENLSYGQQKLLAIACCLATGARVIFLDEPVAGVDPQMAIYLREMLVRLGGQGERLVVFVEHDLSFVRDTADQVVLMREGRIVSKGRTAELLNSRLIFDLYQGAGGPAGVAD